MGRDAGAVGGGRTARSRPARTALLRGGIPLGLSAALVAMVAASGDRSGLRDLIAICVIVTAIVAASAIYEIDEWSLRSRTIAHSLAMACTALPALMLSGWIDLSRPSAILIALTLYAVGGAVLWTFGYLINRPPSGARTERNRGSAPSRR